MTSVLIYSSSGGTPNLKIGMRASGYPASSIVFLNSAFSWSMYSSFVRCVELATRSLTWLIHFSFTLGHSFCLSILVLIISVSMLFVKVPLPQYLLTRDRRVSRMRPIAQESHRAWNNLCDNPPVVSCDCLCTRECVGRISSLQLIYWRSDCASWKSFRKKFKKASHCYLPKPGWNCFTIVTGVVATWRDTKSWKKLKKDIYSTTHMPSCWVTTTLAKSRWSGEQ